MTEIRQIAAAADGDALFVTAEFERRVHLWSFASRSLVASLDTVFESGGDRVALCGEIVVAGAWEDDGIRAYAPDGTELWRRPELDGLQQLAPVGAAVAACFEEGPMLVLALDSGATLAEVDGVRWISASRFAPVGLGEVDGHAVLFGTEAWDARWEIALEGFALLAAAAAPGAVAFGDADTGAAIRALSLAGEELWRAPTPAGVNCQALAWDPDAPEWVGVLKEVDHERPDTLVRWSPGGTVVAEHELGLFAAHAFLPSGRYLVTSAGEVRDTRDGAVVWTF